MRKLILALLVFTLASSTNAANPNEIIEIPTDGWVFDNQQCFAEAINVDEGQFIRVRLRISGGPEDPRIKVSNRSTDKLYGTGDVTGYRYQINQVWSPIPIPGVPPEFTSQVSYNNGRGAVTALLRFNVFSPGAPELGHLLIHGIGHVIYTGGDSDEFTFTKESFSEDCVGPQI
jgi:hypothetical protein